MLIKNTNSWPHPKPTAVKWELAQGIFIFLEAL